MTVVSETAAPIGTYCDLETGDWRLETGDWRLELVYGVHNRTVHLVFDRHIPEHYLNSSPLGLFALQICAVRATCFVCILNQAGSPSRHRRTTAGE